MLNGGYYPYDPQKAAALMTQAGLVKVGDRWTMGCRAHGTGNRRDRYPHTQRRDGERSRLSTGRPTQLAGRQEHDDRAD
jgi:hypothetical protein